jgi:hypothetical protein
MTYCRTLWRRFLHFWAKRLLAGEHCLGLASAWLECRRRYVERVALHRRLLHLEVLEPRWVLSHGSIPIVTPAAYSILNDQTLTVSTIGAGVLANDSGSGPLRVVGYTAPSYGTLTLTPTGTFTYTPEAGYVGMDSFAYSVSDGTGEANGTVTLNVTAADQPLNAAPNSYSILQDQTLTVSSPSAGVLANNYDPNGAPLSIAGNTAPANGTLTLNSNGTFTYTPNPGYVGADSFTYTVSDGIVEAIGTVTVNVTEAVLPLNAVPQSYSILHDQTLTVSSASMGVLANDYDPNGAPLSVVSYTAPSYGTLTLNSDGTFTYIPNASYVGTDSFTCTISDGIGEATGIVTIDVTDPPPVTAPTSYSILHDQTLTVSSVDDGVLANDYDPNGTALSIASYTAPSYGTPALSSTGTFTYTPDAGYVGPDSFTYQVTDGIVETTGTVTINVWDRVPVAVDDSYSIAENQTLTVASAEAGVLANDSGTAPLSVVGYTAPAFGTLTLNPTGTFTYTPDAGFVGTDSFIYTVSDGALTNSATVTINVTDASLVAVNQSYSTYQNVPLTISNPSQGLLVNDSSSTGATLTISNYTQPANGSVSVNSDGVFSYTPNPGYYGPDSFTYTVTDGTLSAVAFVNVTVVQPEWIWEGPAGQISNWANAANWDLVDPKTNAEVPNPLNTYPGAAFAGVGAIVVFQNPNAGDAALDDPLDDNIATLELTGWQHTLFLYCDLTVTGPGRFFLDDGSSIEFASGVSFSLLGLQGRNEWNSGTLANSGSATGTSFNIIGSSLVVDGAAKTLGPMMVIQSLPQIEGAALPGTVTLENMKGNVTLNGTGNYIDVKSGGTLELSQTILVNGQQDQRGGIISTSGGTQSVLVETGGTLVRDGAAVNGVFNEVVINGCVYNEGGTVTVTQPVAFATLNGTGNAYWQYATATAQLTLTAPLVVFGAMEIDDGTLELVNGVYPGYLLQTSGGLTFGADDPTTFIVGGRTGNGVFRVGGSVTLSGNTITKLSFSGTNNTADMLNVQGVLTLNGTLSLQSVDFPPQAPSNWLIFFQATSTAEAPITGQFGTIDVVNLQNFTYQSGVGVLDNGILQTWYFAVLIQ